MFCALLLQNFLYFSLLTLQSPHMTSSGHRRAEDLNKLGQNVGTANQKVSSNRQSVQNDRPLPVNNAKCPPNFKLCQNLNCIGNQLLCDGFDDCGDESDELLCGTVNQKVSSNRQSVQNDRPLPNNNVKCLPNFTLCQNLNCIGNQYLCDGFDDCGDDSDELWCDKKHLASIQLTVCPKDKFQCEKGPCVHRAVLCNGVQDCPHGDDEANCTRAQTANCEKGFARCNDNLCIPIEYLCDGEVDCKDSSDELGCWHNPVLTTPLPTTIVQPSRVARMEHSCPAFKFHCGSGECIDVRLTCDNMPDCKDKSDEASWCHVCSNGNGGCQEYCTPTPFGPKCSCRVGFVSDDGQSCRDPNECINGNTICDHFCTMKENKYHCYCAFGYEVTGDGTRCKLVISDGHLIFSTGSELRTLELFNDLQRRHYGLMHHVAKEARISSVSYSGKKHRAYYAAVDKIFYVNYKSESTCAVGGFSKGVNIAVDWITENVYYAENDPPMLGVCRSDGRYCHEFYHNKLLRVNGLALHPKRGLMFWTDRSNDGPRIERASMDGTNRKIVVDHKILFPLAITLDYIHEKLYWADAGLNLIERSNIDGSNREPVVYSATKHPTDLLLFNGKIYWTDLFSSAIWSADTHGPSSNMTKVHSSPFEPTSLTINHTAYHNLSLPNPCETTTCQYLCVLRSDNEVDVEAKCICPTGYTIQLKSPNRCYPTNSVKTTTRIQWCINSFKEACSKKLACFNNGKCSNETYDPERFTTSLQCSCPSGFVGLYCEVAIEASVAAASSLVTRKSSSSAMTVGIILALLLFSVVVRR